MWTESYGVLGRLAHHLPRDLASISPPVRRPPAYLRIHALHHLNALHLLTLHADFYCGGAAPPPHPLVDSLLASPASFAC